MADFDGAVAGIQAFHTDQDTQVATQERQAQIQHLGALTQQAAMQTRLEGAKLQEQERKLQILANFKMPVAGQDEHGDMSPGDMLSSLGTSMITAGMFKEGGALVNQGSEIKNREAMQRLASQKAQATLAAQKVKKLDSLHNFLATAHDEESTNSALMLWMNENPGEEVPPELRHYNKPLFDGLRKVTKTGQEEARRQDAEQREADQDRDRRMRQDMADRREDRMDRSQDRMDQRERLAEQRETLAEKRQREDLAERTRRDDMTDRHQKALESYQERRLARERKAGAPKPATSANNSDMQAAQAMIMRDFPDLPGDIPTGKGKDAPLMSSAAYDLANEARNERNKNPALSMPEAMTRVYAQMKQNGDFQVTAKPPSMVDKLLNKVNIPTKEEKSTAYKPATPAPKAADAPIPFTPGMKPEKGKVYSAKGEKWRLSDDGKKMVKVE